MTIIALALYVIALVLGTIIAKRFTGIEGGLPALLLSWLVGVLLMFPLHRSGWCPITPENAAWVVVLMFATNGTYKLRKKALGAVIWAMSLLRGEGRDKERGEG